MGEGSEAGLVGLLGEGDAGADEDGGVVGGRTRLVGRCHSASVRATRCVR